MSVCYFGTWGLPIGVLPFCHFVQGHPCSWSETLQRLIGRHGRCHDMIQNAVVMECCLELAHSSCTLLCNTPWLSQSTMFVRLYSFVIGFLFLRCTTMRSSQPVSVTTHAPCCPSSTNFSLLPLGLSSHKGETLECDSRSRWFSDVDETCILRRSGSPGNVVHLSDSFHLSSFFFLCICLR